MPRLEDLRRDHPLELVVMRGREPMRIVGGFDEFLRHRIAGRPKLHRLVVDRVAKDQHRGRRIGGVLERAHSLKVDRGAGF